MILARLVTLADNNYEFSPFLKLFPRNFPSNKKLPLFVSIDFGSQIIGRFIIFTSLILSDLYLLQ